MNSMLIYPKIESDAAASIQLQEMKSYLRQFRDEVEMILSNISLENLSPKAEEELSTKLVNKMVSGGLMSTLMQTPGSIVAEVRDLEGTVSSLAVGVSGIYAQINNADTGVIARLDVAESGISASVKKGTSYSGLSITSSGVRISSSGGISINGNVIITGSLSVDRLQTNSQGDLVLPGILTDDVMVQGDITQLGTAAGAYLSNITTTGDVTIGGDLTINGEISGYRFIACTDKNGVDCRLLGTYDVG